MEDIVFSPALNTSTHHVNSGFVFLWDWIDSLNDGIIVGANLFDNARLCAGFLLH
jgi:hypothetical protein